MSNPIRELPHPPQLGAIAPEPPSFRAEAITGFLLPAFVLIAGYFLFRAK